METNQDRQGIALILNNMGTIYYLQGKYTQALEYLQKSLQLEDGKEVTIKPFRMAIFFRCLQLLYNYQSNNFNLNH